MPGSSDDAPVSPIFDVVFQDALARWSAPSLNVDVLTPDLKAMAIVFLQQHRLQTTTALWHQVAAVIRDRLGVEHAAFLWLLNSSRDEIVQYFRDPQPFAAQIRAREEQHDESLYYPTTGWLADYLDYTREHEAPTLFHCWVGATVLSAAICRRVALNFNTFRVYPNLFTILVAPTGVCRKSSAIDLGVSLLRTALQDGRLVLFDGKATPERIVQAIAQEALSPDGKRVQRWSHGFIVARELFYFLGRQRYNEGLISLLTDLYDCQDVTSVETIGRQREELYNVYVTMLAGSTAKWLRMAIPPEAQGAGFIPRFVLPTRTVVERIFSRSIRSPREFEQHQRRLIAYLQTLLVTPTRYMTLTKQTNQRRDEWYQAERHKRVPEDDIREGFAARRDATVLKLAMLLTMAVNVNAKVIELDVWEQALKMILFTESTMGPALAAIGTERSGELQQRILGQFVRWGGTMTHRKIHSLNCRTAKGPDIRVALSTLIASGLIVEMAKPDHHYILVPSWKEGE